MKNTLFMLMLTSEKPLALIPRTLARRSDPLARKPKIGLRNRSSLTGKSRYRLFRAAARTR